MTTRDLRTPTSGLRPPVQVPALPDDHPRVVEWVRKIAEASTPNREMEGEFVGWIDPDKRRAVA